MADGKGKDEGGKLLYCSFCGKNQNEVRKLIAGPSVYICDECVDLCNDIIREEVLDADAESDEERLPVPREIRRTLDEYVIAQDRAKKILSVAVYSHFRRVESVDKMPPSSRSSTLAASACNPVVGSSTRSCRSITSAV